MGGISKFVAPLKDQVVEALGLTPGCFVGLTAGKKLAAQKTAGVLRTKLGALCPEHMDKERYEFCWIVDSPCPTAVWRSWTRPLPARWTP